MNGVVCKHAEGMSSRQNAKRSVLGRGIVKMNSQGENLRQSACGSMRVSHAFLDRPRSPFRNFPSLFHGQSRVLMPRDQPVCRGRFVEQCGFEGESLIPKNASGDSE